MVRRDRLSAGLPDDAEWAGDDVPGDVRRIVPLARPESHRRHARRARYPSGLPDAERRRRIAAWRRPGAPGGTGDCAAALAGDCALRRERVGHVAHLATRTFVRSA